MATKTSKTTKTKTKTAASKATNKTASKSEGLRKPQLRVLEALAKAKSDMTRPEISSAGKVDLAALSEYIGKVDPAARAQSEAKWGFKSLLSLGYVAVSAVEGESATYYKITAAGRKALAAAKAAE